MTTETEVPGRARRGLTRHLPLAVILTVAAIGAISLHDYLSFDALAANREALLALRDSNFGVAVALFMAVYVLIVTFSLPGATVASVTGGFLFGLVAGTAFSVVSATIGAAAIFLAARRGMGEVLSARFEASRGRAARIREGLRANEVSVLLVMRLVPAVPFFLANLLPAMVGVRTRTFLWTTAIGIVPGATVYTWVGVGLGEVFDRGGRPDLSIMRDPQVFGPLIALGALAALPIVIRAFRRSRGG